MASSPTISQQRALEYIPKPFAIISFLSSGYVASYLLFQKPEKRKRLYQRLVLYLNLAGMAGSFATFYGNWAVPVGTPGYVGAMGNIQSCTGIGFIDMVMVQTVPIYYGSLSLQSAMAIRNNFKEENYVWIEKWIHLVAWIIPCALVSFLAATENINPSNAGVCWGAQAPIGCESDPEILCERGQDITPLVYIFGLGQYLLYLIYPPSGTLAIYLYLKKIQRRLNSVSPGGMQLVRASSQKRVLRNVTVQISVYCFSFWFTNLLSMIHGVYSIVTGGVIYNLLILGHMMSASRGFVIAMVYFTLENIGRRSSKVGYLQRERASPDRAPQLTVSDIRQNAEMRSDRVPPGDEPEEPITFHIFDGTPDEDSPWAMYFSQNDDEDDDAGTEDELPEKDSQPKGDLEQNVSKTAVIPGCES